MAEIPVERKKGGLPWWLIPLLLLLLLLPLLFFFSRSCNERAGVVENTNTNGNVNRAVATTTNANTTNIATNTNVTTNANSPRSDVENAGTATGPKVTDVGFFSGVDNKSTLVGRAAEFTNVKVNRVLSDRVFTVTSGSGEMFALLDENLDTGGGKEKQIKMRTGQTVNLSGDFRRVPDAETRDEQQRNLNQREYAQMKGQDVYLHVGGVKDAK